MVAPLQHLLEQRARAGPLPHRRERVDVPEGADVERVPGLAEVILGRVPEHVPAAKKARLDGLHGAFESRIPGIVKSEVRNEEEGRVHVLPPKAPV